VLDNSINWTTTHFWSKLACVCAGIPDI